MPRLSTRKRRYWSLSVNLMRAWGNCTGGASIRGNSIGGGAADEGRSSRVRGEGSEIRGRGIRGWATELRRFECRIQNEECGSWQPRATREAGACAANIGHGEQSRGRLANRCRRPCGQRLPFLNSEFGIRYSNLRYPVAYRQAFDARITPSLS